MESPGKKLTLLSRIGWSISWNLSQMVNPKNYSERKILKKIS